jgi:cytochrome c
VRLNLRSVLGAFGAGFALAVLLAAPGASQDAGRGKELFEKRCTGCHALDNDKEGPRLRGVFGRTSGTVESFSYSDALKKAAIRWDADSLDRWLTDPGKVVPDNDMAFRVAKGDERSDIIAFLKSLPTK